MRNIFCLIGLHKPTVIGHAPYPYDLEYTLLAFGCSRCGKRLKNGKLVKTVQEWGEALKTKQKETEE